LKWNGSIIHQIKQVCEQVEQLQLAIILLIGAILLSTAFLSLVYLSTYFDDLKQIWWQLLVFNSGLTINMLKIMYDIAEVGANFVKTVEDFENIFVGEHFKFNKEFQQQFDQIFHIHSTIVMKWINLGVSIKVFGTKINSASVLGLVLVLLSQLFVYLIHYIYQHIIKPFLG